MSGVAIVICLIIAFAFSDAVVAILMAPAVGVEAGHAATMMNFDAVTSAFDFRLRVSFGVGIIAAAPVWLAQLWGFLLPALQRKEKWLVGGFGAGATVLFAAGCAAGWVVTPHIVQMMATFVPMGAVQFLKADLYLDFVLKLVLLVGIAFVLPLFLVLLNAIGVLSGRTILRGWRVAILAVTVFTAIATPAADVISMFLLAIPMLVLYFAAAGCALAVDRGRARRADHLAAPRFARWRRASRVPPEEITESAHRS